MRVLLGVLCAAAVAGAPCALTAPASAAFADQLCPEATQYVNALLGLKQQTPQAVYEAAHATSDAYEVCARRLLGTGNFEPGVHYAYTREASFDIVQARALLALGRMPDAKAVTQDAKRLAGDVVDWRGGNGSGTVDNHRPSLYFDAAKEVVASADAMLAQLANPPAAAAAPAPAPLATAAPHR